jgi:alkyl hydroperoxide reductase subunit AhpC
MTLVQHTAPDFKATAVMPDNSFKDDYSLADSASKWRVLFFYPLDFTFVCPTEILAFSDAVDEFTKIDTQLIGISVDSHFTHLAWKSVDRKEGGISDLKYPLVADLNKSIARDYGVLLEDAGVALRGLFVIDPNNIVRAAIVHDLPVGRSVQEVLRVVKAFQFTEKHGEVCPANWDEGGATMIADPEKSKEYFAKV